MRTQRGAKSVCEWCSHVCVYICVGTWCVYVGIGMYTYVLNMYTYVGGMRLGRVFHPMSAKSPNSKSQRAFPARTSPALNFLNWVCPSCIVFKEEMVGGRSTCPGPGLPQAVLGEPTT